ncbi:hypothetical protein KFK09_010648 [Dendrobium nobile]|uniref:Uncharacterized protein n=1 Tax=Dendrobium nobile TaxID=94219 RepID=A0A8T3BG76_DENNO|nr:hypothetical protein KFK09_010648 [Dendrobium nobile]
MKGRRKREKKRRKGGIWELSCHRPPPEFLPTTTGVPTGHHRGTCQPPPDFYPFSDH